METKRIDRHKKLSLHYFDNALRYINGGDAEKAGEFLWGSISQAVKAVAASKDFELRNHRRLREYAMELPSLLKKRILGMPSIEPNICMVIFMKQVCC